MDNHLKRGIRLFQSTEYQKLRDIYLSFKTGHHPKAAMVSCVDARVDPNKLVQATPGTLAVERTLGNVPSDGYLEFVVKGRKVEDLVIMGHYDCGAVQARLHPETLENLPHIVAQLEGKIQDRAGLLEGHTDEPEVQFAVCNNVLDQREKVLALDFVQEAIRNRGLRVHAWYNECNTGKVFQYNEEEGVFELLLTDSDLTSEPAQRTTQMTEVKPYHVVMCLVILALLVHIGLFVAARKSEEDTAVCDDASQDYFGMRLP